MHKQIAAMAAAGAACLSLTVVSPARAELAQPGAFVERPLTLPKGRLRIDVAPSDYAYMDMGVLNDGRGMRLWVAPNNTTFYMGAGAALGIIDDFEVGALLLPITMAPNGNFGNLEAYARYRFLRGNFELGVQGTMQIPTDGQFGVGFGLPALWHISDSVRLDTGIELELVTGPFQAHMDIPLAVAFNVAGTFFLGPRTGMRVHDFNGVSFPLGLFLGGTVADAVDITGAVTWPWLVYASPYSEDTFNPNVVEFTVGVNLYFDVF